MIDKLSKSIIHLKFLIHLFKSKITDSILLEYIKIITFKDSN